MGQSLAGKTVDDILVEFYGPHTGRNYFEVTVAPQLSIFVAGTTVAESIVVEKNTTLEFVGTNNSNAVGSTPMRGGKLLPTRTPADWVPLLTIVGPTPIVIVLPLPAENFEHGIRVRISVKPDVLSGGNVEVATQWN